MEDEVGTPVLPGPLERPEQNFSGRAVDVLREMLLLGQFEPGQRLNEVELASALGISRGPLREAIQRLLSEGLLTAVSGRGAYVRTFTADTVRDLYEVRIALEAHAVRLVTNHLTSEDVAELRDTPPLDLHFHQRLVALSRNPPLLETTIGIHRQIRLARRHSRDVDARAAEALGEHQVVLDHLDAGRVDEAAETLTEHLRRSLRSALELRQDDQTSG